MSLPLLGAGNAGGVAGVPWTPADISTLQWLDFSDAANVTLTGALIDQADDLSSLGNHPVQATATNKPTYDTATNTINGLAVMSPDGTDNFLAVAGLSGFPADNNGVGNEVQIVQVVRTRNLTDRGLIDFTDATLTNRTALVLASGGNMRARCGTATSDPAIAFSDTTNPHIWSTLHFISNRQIRLDGGAATTNATPTSARNYTNMRIGRLFQDVFPMLGDYGEVIVFQGTSSTDRQKAEGYLAHKWGVTLAAGHPYEFSPPTV